MSNARLGLAIAIAAAACSSPADSRHEPRPSPLVLVNPPASGHWAHYRVDRAAGIIDVYLAHDTKPKPVLILIHGSGCAPVMTADPDGTLHDTTMFQDLVRPRLDRLHFAIVEKRGVQPLRFSKGLSQSEKASAFRRAEAECSTEYVQHVTKDGRVNDVAATVVALTREPWVREIILAGHSEGTHVTTGVLRTLKDSRIAAAGLFASAGPIPFFGGRLDSTPIEDVRDSAVPLFVAQGARDGTTIPADLFTIEAVRQQPARPIRYVVVDQGGHTFDTPDGKSRLVELFDDFVKWALDPDRQTSLDVLK